MKFIKIVIVLLLLLAGGLTGTTYYFGGRIESDYFALLKEHDHWGPFAVSCQSYERGLLRSKALTVLTVGNPADKDAVRLTFEHSLAHGPLPLGDDAPSPALVRIETRLIACAPEQDWMPRLLQTIPELKQTRMLLRIGFDGEAQGHAEIPAFDKKIDSTTVNWGGLQLETTIRNMGQSVTAALTMPRLGIKDDAGEMTWTDFSALFDLSETFPMVYLGNSALDLQTLNLRVPGEGGGTIQAQLSGLRFTADSAAQGPLIGFTQTLAFKDLSTNVINFGPSTCTIEMKNLDGMAISTLRTRVMDVIANLDASNAESQLAQLLPLYQEVGLKLLKSNPELNIPQLHLATARGDLNAHFQLRYADQPGISLQNPLTLLQAVHAKAAVTIQENLIKAVAINAVKDQFKTQGQAATDAEIAALVDDQYEQQVQALLEQKLAVRKDSALSTTATLEGGQLLVNGQAMPLF